MLVSTANRLFTLLVTSRAFLRLFLSYPPPLPLFPNVLLSYIHSQTRSTAVFSPPKQLLSSKTLSWLTNANTLLLRHRRKWHPVLTCRIGTNHYFLNRRTVFLSKYVTRSHDRLSPEQLFIR